MSNREATTGTCNTLFCFVPGNVRLLENKILSLLKNDAAANTEALETCALQLVMVASSTEPTISTTKNALPHLFIVANAIDYKPDSPRTTTQGRSSQPQLTSSRGLDRAQQTVDYTKHNIRCTCINALERAQQQRNEEVESVVERS